MDPLLRGNQTTLLVILAHQVDERQGHQQSPNLSDDLPCEKTQAAEGQREEQDTVHANADQPAGQHGENQSPALQRGKDQCVGSL
jgi:hypothetical protein